MGYEGKMHDFTDCEKSLPEPTEEHYTNRSVFSCDVCGQHYRVYRFEHMRLFTENEVEWMWEKYEGEVY